MALSDLTANLIKSITDEITAAIRTAFQEFKDAVKIPEDNTVSNFVQIELANVTFGEVKIKAPNYTNNSHSSHNYTCNSLRSHNYMKDSRRFYTFSKRCYLNVPKQFIDELLPAFKMRRKIESTLNRCAYQPVMLRSEYLDLCEH